jgi:glycosyltransferase involved in cell wall biosynthesis
MPVRNEGSFIHQALDAVLAQTYPLDRMEIIIADGMSTDNTRQVVRDYQQKFPNIRLVDNEGKIAPTGLNAALQLARGDIVVRVDGHCIIQPDYVQRCVDHLGQEDVDGVGGPMETVGETPVAQAIALAMSSPFGVGGSAFRTIKDRKMFVDTVAFPAYKQETIRKAGLFDEELVRNQDDEYNFRLREMGGRILMTPDIRSSYYSRSSFKSLWRQYFQYGYWKVRVMQKHPRQMSLRQFVPPTFVGALIILSVLSLFMNETRILLALVVAAYLMANLAATLLTTARTAGGSWPYLPFAFGTLHIAYGAGFLFGLMKFANRWGTDTPALIPATAGPVTQPVRPMNVLMITSEWPTAETPHVVPFIVRQVRSLRDAGVDVEVFPFRGGKNPLNYYRAWRRARKVLSSRPFDLVHAQWGQSGLLALPKHLPLVVTFRGDDLEGIIGQNGRQTLRGRVLQNISRMVARSADQVIVVSDRLSRSLPRSDYQVIPSGLDLDLFRPIPQSEARQRLGLHPNRCYVLFAGASENPRKRYDLAKQAVDRLAKDMDVELLTANHVPHAQIPDYMNASDVLLLVSLHEGSPNVVKEALACNLPVVSTDVGDVRKRIEGMPGCQILEEASPEAVAAALRKVLSDHIRPNSRPAVMELDEKLLTQKVIGGYRQALSKK